MEPIAELTAAAREVERSRDPTVRIPRTESEDEVAELGPHAGVDARRARRGPHRDRGGAGPPAGVRRRRLARAAHAADLRAGQPGAARGDAGRRAARGRRLRPALLAPDAPAGRRPAAAGPRRRRPRRRPTSPSTSSSVVTEAASELEPVAGGHEISVAAPAGRSSRRARRAAPPDPEPDGERAAPHGPRHGGRGAGQREDGQVVLAVEDDGPGIPEDLPEKVFERFFRGSSDRGGSSGPRALDRARRRRVPPRHASGLVPPLDGRGARFVVRLPARDRLAGLPPAVAANVRPQDGGPAVDSLGRPSSRSTATNVRHHPLAARRLLARHRGVRPPIGSVHEIIRYTETTPPLGRPRPRRGSAASSASAETIPIFNLAKDFVVKPFQARDRGDRCGRQGALPSARRFARSAGPGAPLALVAGRGVLRSRSPPSRGRLDAPGRTLDALCKRHCGLAVDHTRLQSLASLEPGLRHSGNLLERGYGPRPMDTARSWTHVR